MIVTINNVNMHSLSLDYLGRTIATPSYKENKVSVPFRDGDIDLTEAISGITRFENRQIELRFEIRTVRYEWMDTMMDLYARFHGKRVELSFGDDADFVWLGRCAVGTLEDHGYTAGVTLTIDAEPFKRTKSAVYTHTYTVNGSLELTLNNSHMRGYPAFVPSTEMTVSDDVEIYTITPTVNTAYGLVLENGANHLSFNGNGTVQVKYWGGDL